MEMFCCATEKMEVNIVEIFRTDVMTGEEANKMTHTIRACYPGHKINFDLEDSDKIFRMEGEQFIPENVASIFNEHGFMCKLLS